MPAPDGSAREVTVQLRHKAHQVALPNAVPWSAPAGGTADRMTVRYTDGSTAEETLQAGGNPAAWTIDPGSLRGGPVAWQARLPAGTPLTLRLTRWNNSHPDRTIFTVRFEPVDDTKEEEGRRNRLPPSSLFTSPLPALPAGGIRR